jgi:protein phosphatase
MKCDFFSLTDTGRIRVNNEDALAVHPARGLVVLADGMGGYNAGEVASHLATHAVADRFAVLWSDDDPPARVMPLVLDAMLYANRAVFEAAQANPDHRGMATTLVTAVFQGSRVTIGHVGDSRAYRLRQGRFVGLTRDHSLLQEKLDAGLIPPHLARVAHDKNLVTRAIGVAAQVNVDVHEHLVQPGDTYLFCSDGLNDMLADTEMAQVLLHFGPLERAGHELLRRANEAGGRDNISLVLVQCSPQSAHPLHPSAAMAQSTHPMSYRSPLCPP